MPGYCLVTAGLLPSYCLVTCLLLPGYFLATTCLLPGYCLVVSWLLPCYCVVTSWLLPCYCLVTAWLLSGYCLVTSWSSVSPKNEVCFFCAFAITFQLTSTASPSVAQHVFTSCCSVSCSVNPDLYGSRMFITVHTKVRTYTEMSFGNRKREVHHRIHNSPHIYENVIW